MPRVKLDYVVSFSSEDSDSPASNLLSYDVSKKKWLCNVGEPSCSVVLQLARAVQISTVHIGAYHAALVEVLVGRSDTPNDPFEVLVPSSVFVSPMDSRRGSGVERVRSFSAEQLAPAKDKRWDRVRVVCSQPYNKHCKYGLSFIHIFEAEDRNQSLEPTQPTTAVPARVTVTNNYSSDEDDFRPGELFAKHQQRASDAGTSRNTEAQIRQATSQALKNITDSSTKLVKTPISKNNSNRPDPTNDVKANRQRDTLMYDDDDEKPHTKIDSIVQRHKDEKEQETKKKEAVQNLFKKDRNTSRLETASKNFKEFLDADNRDLSSSRSKETSRDDKRNQNSCNNSSDRKKTENLNNSRSKDSSNGNDRRNKDNLNNSRSKDNSRGDDRRNKDDSGKTSQRTQQDKPNGDRDSRKRQHSDDRQKGKDVLRAGPVSSSPHTLLSGVVFALSGYENPRRGRLRDQAIAMGARFERDWNPSCTHLICAFPNTPKLRTVRSSQGNDCIAVLGDWIEQCCEKRRLLPWQWFATEPKKKVTPPPGWDADDDKVSECDTDDEIEKVLRKQKKQRTDTSPSQAMNKSPQPHSREKSPKPHSSRDRSPKPHSSKDRSPKPHSNKDRSPKPHSSKDRLPKPHTSKERSPKPHSSKEKSPKLYSSKEKPPKNISSHNTSNVSTDSDVAFVKDERIQANVTIDSGDSTDEEKPSAKERVDKSKVLPDFFEGCTFVIDDGVAEAGFDKELLVRYVMAYGGVVMDASQLEPDDEVNYVLSAGAESELKGQRVRADWIWRCHREKQLCDLGEFAL